MASGFDVPSGVSSEFDVPCGVTNEADGPCGVTGGFIVPCNIPFTAPGDVFFDVPVHSRLLPFLILPPKTAGT